MIDERICIEDIEINLNIHEYNDIVRHNLYDDYFFIETSGFINLLNYYEQFNYRLKKGIINIATSIHNVKQVVEHIKYSMKKNRVAIGGLYNFKKILANPNVVIIQMPRARDRQYLIYGNDAIWLEIFFSAGFSKLVIHDNPVQDLLPKIVTVYNPQQIREM